MHGEMDQGLQAICFKIRPSHLDTRHRSHYPPLGQTGHGDIHRLASASKAHDPAPHGSRVMQADAGRLQQADAQMVCEVSDTMRNLMNSDGPGVADRPSEADLPRDMASKGEGFYDRFPPAGKAEKAAA